MKLSRRRFARLCGGVAVLVLAGCAQRPPSRFRSYSGPEVTRVLVFKGSRRMYLMHHDTVLKYYDVELGFAPRGHKRVEGDGRTPEGDYRIDRRNPNSRFHLSLGIDYPRAADVARAAALGRSPGGDIFIHGGPVPGGRAGRDWTDGCIAVTDPEMEEIYAMVRTGTPISIRP